MGTRRNQRPKFAFTASITAGGAGVYSGWEILVPSGLEVAVHYLLNPAGSLTSIFTSAVSMIPDNRAEITAPSKFAPATYSRQCTIFKGTTTVAPPVGSYTFGFDNPMYDELIVAGPLYLVGVQFTANQTVNFGVIFEERDPAHPYWFEEGGGHQ